MLEIPDLGASGSRCAVFFRALTVVAGCCGAALLSASRAEGDVGELGPPPADAEIRQTLVDFYDGAGHPRGSTVDVEFVGPIQVGPPQEHANPPPGPWCVRCGHPDPGISSMYPVMALVKVTVIQSLDSSALGPKVVENTVTYNGTTCPGETRAQYCPAYYFYRDGRGSWQVA